MRVLRHVATVLSLAALLGIFAVYLTPAFSQSTALWPQATTCAVTTTSAQCIGTNPTRRGLQICNVGSGTGGTTGQAVAIWIAPGSNVAATTGATGSYPLAAEASNVATCFTPPSGIINSVGNSWNAISVTSGGTLSIYEW